MVVAAVREMRTVPRDLRGVEETWHTRLLPAFPLARELGFRLVLLLMIAVAVAVAADVLWKKIAKHQPTRTTPKKRPDRANC